MNIGFFPSSLETFFTHSDKKLYSSFLFVNKTSREYQWTQSLELKEMRLVPYVLITNKSFSSLTYEEIIVDENFTLKCREFNINLIVAPYKISKKMNQWSMDQNIGFVSVSHTHQEKLEDKIWFDNFLKKYTIKKPQTISNSSIKTINVKKKIVIQEPHSEGSEGTFIINNQKDLNSLLETKKISLYKKYLVREFIPGPVYGISIFISKGLISLSSLRQQIFDHYPERTDEFIGIQWLSLKDLRNSESKEIHQVFINLSKKLLIDGFEGLLSFDFILYRGKCYVLECNPRFTSATVQILAHQELINHIDVINKDILNHMDSSQKTNPITKIAQIPNAVYSGSTLFIKAFKKSAIRKTFNNGLYSLIDEKITFISPNISEFRKGEHTFIFYSEMDVGEKCEDGEIIADIYFNFKLYKTSGKLNVHGKRLIDFFNYYE